MIKDANILLSLVNTYLRNGNGSLEDFAFDNNTTIFEVEKILGTIGYYFDSEQNKFILK